jgi:hypothetical protein
MAQGASDERRGAGEQRAWPELLEIFKCELHIPILSLDKSYPIAASTGNTACEGNIESNGFSHCLG